MRMHRSAAALQKGSEKSQFNVQLMWKHSTSAGAGC